MWRCVPSKWFVTRCISDSGSVGVCSGKRSTVHFLVSRYGFRKIFFREIPSLAFVPDDTEATVLHKPLVFCKIVDLVDFVTRNWRERLVLGNVDDEILLDSLLRRPFFLLVSIEAPTTLRWTRFKAKRARASGSSPDGPNGTVYADHAMTRAQHECSTFEDFVSQSDLRLYHPVSGLARLIAYAEVRLINSSTNLSQLHEALEKLDLVDEHRLRPSWDQYFMQLASLAAQRSNCMKRRVGCVLIRERRVISTGYNGTPRNLQNCNDGGCKLDYLVRTDEAHR